MLIGYEYFLGNLTQSSSFCSSPNQPTTINLQVSVNSFDWFQSSYGSTSRSTTSSSFPSFASDAIRSIFSKILSGVALINWIGRMRAGRGKSRISSGKQGFVVVAMIVGDFCNVFFKKKQETEHHISIRNLCSKPLCSSYSWMLLLYDMAKYAVGVFLLAPHQIKPTTLRSIPRKNQCRLA